VERTTGWAGGGPVAFDLGGLWRRLAALTDGRRARGKRYALPLLLVLIVLAKLSGEDRPSGIADWVRHRRARLAQALGVGLARAPHHNTYRRAGAVPAVAWRASDPANLGASPRNRIMSKPRLDAGCACRRPGQAAVLGHSPPCCPCSADAGT